MIYVDTEDYTTTCITLKDCRELTPDVGKYYAPIVLKTKVNVGDAPTAGYPEIEIESSL